MLSTKEMVLFLSTVRKSTVIWLSPLSYYTLVIYVFMKVMKNYIILLIISWKLQQGLLFHYSSRPSTRRLSQSVFHRQPQFVVKVIKSKGSRIAPPVSHYHPGARSTYFGFRSCSVDPCARLRKLLRNVLAGSFRDRSLYPSNAARAWSGVVSR